MCTGIEIALLAGGAMSAGSSIDGGLKAMKAGYKQQALNEVDARAEIRRSQNVVKLIRKQKEDVQSAARAAYSGVGVQVDTGTAGKVVDDIGARATDDMIQTLIEGGQRARRIRQEGKQAVEQGQDAMTASTLNAASSVLGTYSKIGGGWK